MTIQTVATKMLGIEHPIICGGMTATGSPGLAAAISEAGGLGMLTALHARTPAKLHAMIQECRGLTKKPFGVNLTILGEKRGEPEFPHEFVKVITANNIRIVETCGASVVLMVELHRLLRAGGVQVIMSKCVEVKHALTAQNKLGADLVSLMAFDSGGLPGEADVGMVTQLALARRALTIPFLASGGVATGRQLLAALASGAAGVQIGTRFNATVECDVFPPSFKHAMVKAGYKDTVMVMKPFKASSRVYKNSTALALLEVQRSKGAHLSFADVASLAKFDLLRQGMASDDANTGVWNCGQSVALIEDVVPCEVLVRRIIAEAEEAYRGLASLFSASKL